MSEQLGFALVLLVAIASIASMLFLSGVATTGQVSIHPPTESTCAHITCPGHEPAYPLRDARGMVLYHDEGNPMCVCLPR